MLLSFFLQICFSSLVIITTFCGVRAWITCHVTFFSSFVFFIDLFRERHLCLLLFLLLSQLLLMFSSHLSFLHSLLTFHDHWRLLKSLGNFSFSYFLFFLIFDLLLFIMLIFKEASKTFSTIMNMASILYFDFIFALIILASNSLSSCSKRV